MKKKGAVGIGTLIIFIAMVLVAAIAAAVLINVSGILQQKAMATGKESIQQGSSNILVSSIKGYTTDMQDVANLTILVTAAAGAGRIDLRYLIFAIRNDQNDTYLNYTDGAPGTGTFSAEELRDPSNVFTTAAPVVDGSTLVALHILTGANQAPAIHLNSRSKLYLSAIPEHGAAVNIVVQMPESFSTNVIDLYP